MVEGETRRETKNQSLHDEVIAEVTDALLNKYQIAYMNQGIMKNRAIKGKYPDLILFKTYEDDNNNNPITIAEIETDDTIDEYELEEQWLEYLQLGVPFFKLIVPDKSLQKVQKLLKDFKIESEVDLFYYTIDEFGNIDIHI